MTVSGMLLTLISTLQRAPLGTVEAAGNAFVYIIQKAI